MTVVPPGAFADRLRALEQAALAAFVADLWAAAGWETAVEGAVVVVRRDGVRERLLVVPATRVPWLRRAPAHEGPVDAVVVPQRDPARTPRGTPDAPVIDADDLHGRLCYGVDRSEGRRISREHLGVPLVGERWERATERTTGEAGDGDAVAWRALAGPLAVALLLAVLAVGASGWTPWATAEADSVIEYDEATGIDGLATEARVGGDPGPLAVGVSCDRGPRATLELQLLSFQTGGLEGIRGAWRYTDPAARVPAPRGYRWLVRTGEYGPLISAERIRVVAYDRRDGVVSAEVQTVLENGRRDRYEFVLAPGDDGCWRTVRFAWLTNGPGEASYGTDPLSESGSARTLAPGTGPAARIYGSRT